MQVIILCGGLGTRLREETEHRPKPMLEVGAKPILWHIMKYYAHFGFRDFVLALGYRGDMIRDYFLNYHTRNRNFTVDLGTGQVDLHGVGAREDWRVTLVETGAAASTGSRVKQAGAFVQGDHFMVTYGDGLINADLQQLMTFHTRHNRLATLTAIHPPSRFGELDISGDVVRSFSEKPNISQSFVSGGFFVFHRDFLDYLSDAPNCVLESGPLERLAREDQLRAFVHRGFFQCMDTYREYLYLNELWQRGERPWALWEQDEGRQITSQGS